MNDLSWFNIKGGYIDNGTVMRTPSYVEYDVLWGYNGVFDEVKISDFAIYITFGIYLCFEI